MALPGERMNAEKLCWLWSAVEATLTSLYRGESQGLVSEWLPSIVVGETGVGARCGPWVFLISIQEPQEDPSCPLSPPYPCPPTGPVIHSPFWCLQTPEAQESWGARTGAGARPVLGGWMSGMLVAAEVGWWVGGGHQKTRGAEGSALLRPIPLQSHPESFFKRICAYFNSYRHRILACPL